MTGDPLEQWVLNGLLSFHVISTVNALTVSRILHSRILRSWCSQYSKLIVGDEDIRYSIRVVVNV